MIKVHYSEKGTPYVWASDLLSELDIRTPLSMWFPRMIEYGFIENEDYSQHNKKVMLAQGGYNIKKDWAVRIDMAKHIAMIQRSQRGKALREYFLSLDKKVEEGALLTHAQMAALFDICKVMGFFSVQEYFEKEHFNNVFKDKHNRWWDSRARLFGYTVNDLKDILSALGKKYVNQRHALIQIDKYELIRVGIFDMFVAMGKSETYAQNVSEFAKSIAEEIKPEIYDDRDLSIDFKSDHQKDIIADIKEYKNTSSLIETMLNRKPGKTARKKLSSGDIQLDLAMGAALKKGKPKGK